MSSKNPFTVLKEEAPQVNEAFDGLITAISSTGGLDAKTRNLIYIGMKAAQGDAQAVVAHTHMAKNEGASRDEIRDTILITLTVAGVKGVTSCLAPALEVYNQ